MCVGGRGFWGVTSEDTNSLHSKVWCLDWRQPTWELAGNTKSCAPHPDLRNQNLGGGGEQSVCMSLPLVEKLWCSLTRSSLRSTVLTTDTLTNLRSYLNLSNPSLPGVKSTPGLAQASLRKCHTRSLSQDPVSSLPTNLHLHVPTPLQILPQPATVMCHNYTSAKQSPKISIMRNSQRKLRPRGPHWWTLPSI